MNSRSGMTVYSKALSEDPAATLDDLREAVTMLEDAERTARRVLGGAHPSQWKLRAICKPREPRSAPAKATSSPAVRPSRWRRGMRKTIHVPASRCCCSGHYARWRGSGNSKFTRVLGGEEVCAGMCRALGDGAAPAIGALLVDGVDLDSSAAAPSSSA